MSEAILVGLIFADRIITENTGKKGIIGTFTQFNAQKFPVVFPPWYIYAAVTNLVGKHNFALNLVREETNQVVVPISGQIEVKELSDVVELDPPIIGAVFPEAGNYWLSFYIDGYQVGARVLKVLPAPTNN